MVKENKKRKKIIFVTVGTGKFEELIKKVDEIAKNLKYKVIMQIGEGKYTPQNCEFFRFKSSLEEYYKKADFIICHGGAGTIYELLEKGKKILAMANLDRTDTHQEEILKALSEENYIMWCKNQGELIEGINIIQKFKFKKYNKAKCSIHEIIEKFLNNL